MFLEADLNSLIDIIQKITSNKQHPKDQDMEFFEGTEKLLEIWFTKTDENCTLDSDLRDIPRECIDYILDLVNCKVLSFTHSKELDSYVLSESSLFVNKTRLLIKTCGTTTLLNCVRPFIEAACKFCGFDSIQVWFSLVHFVFRLYFNHLRFFK